MKKILAMILALGMTFCVCASCGSSSSDTESPDIEKKDTSSSKSEKNVAFFLDTEEKDSSSTDLEQSDELLKSNNKAAKMLFMAVNNRYADVIVDGGEYTEGEYTFDVMDAMETEGQDDTIKREKYNEEDTKADIEQACWKAFKDIGIKKGFCVVKIADSVITMACYSNSEIGQCAGIFPNPKSEAPSFSILNIPEEYKQVPSYDDEDEDVGVMD